MRHGCTLKIQVCPKKGINPTILLWGWDWDHQTYSREGYGSLGMLHMLLAFPGYVFVVFFFLCTIIDHNLIIKPLFGKGFRTFYNQLKLILSSSYCITIFLFLFHYSSVGDWIYHLQKAKHLDH